MIIETIRERMDKLEKVGLIISRELVEEILADIENDLNSELIGKPEESNA